MVIADSTDVSVFHCCSDQLKIEFSLDALDDPECGEERDCRPSPGVVHRRCASDVSTCEDVRCVDLSSDLHRIIHVSRRICC